MDELLGLALGEGKLRANEPGCCDAGLEPWLAKMGLSRVPLERASVSAYASNDHALSMWKARVQQSKVRLPCPALYLLHFTLTPGTFLSPLFFSGVQCGLFSTYGSMGS